MAQRRPARQGNPPGLDKEKGLITAQALVPILARCHERPGKTPWSPAYCRRAARASSQSSRNLLNARSGLEKVAGTIPVTRENPSIWLNVGPA
jgi:hypothetical protein